MQTYFEYCLLGCFLFDNIRGRIKRCALIVSFLILLLHQHFDGLVAYLDDSDFSVS